MFPDPNDPDERELQNGQHEAEEDALDTEIESDEDGQQGEDAAELAGEDGRQEEVDGTERRPSRGEARFQRLSREAREAKEAAAAAQRELQQFRAEQQARQAQVQEREPTAEDMALWTPQQIIDYQLNKATKGFTQQLQQLQFNSQNSSDIATFTAQQASDPIAKRYAAEVEAMHAEILRAGQMPPPRNVLLDVVYGRALRRKAAEAVPKQRKDGERRIERQRVQAPGGQGDVSRGRERLSDSAAREKRLENATF